MKSERYYEAHVTTDPVEGEKRKQFEHICSYNGFRAADLLMTKGEGALVPWDGDAFCTTRGSDYEEVMTRTSMLVNDLMDRGFGVRRYKIEDTILDSRLGDRLPGVGRALNSTYKKA